MEIRNNTPSPAFGMAFVKPEMVRKAGGIVDSNVDAAMETFERVVFDGKKQSLMSRAIRQMIGKHCGDRHYNIRFLADKRDAKGYVIQIIDKKTNNSVKEIPGDFSSSEFLYPQASDYISKSALRGLSFVGKVRAYCNAAIASIQGAYRRITKPMTELPDTFRKASKLTAELEKAENIKESNIAQAKKIFNQG